MKIIRNVVALVRGATTAGKLRGTKVWVPTPGRLRPAPGQRPGWVLGAGGGHPSRCEVPVYHHRKTFKNSDAKSCILVTTCCEISCFLKTTAKKLGDQYTVGTPNLKVLGDQSPPVPTVVAPMALVAKSLLLVEERRNEVDERWIVPRASAYLP